MTKSLFDASALLALIHKEPGYIIAAEAIGHAAMSAANVGEVVGKLAERGVPPDRAQDIPFAFGIDVIPVDAVIAARAGTLRPITKRSGLSLGDRCCLATAETYRLPVLTTDAAWTSLATPLNLDIRNIRAETD